jgi:hypothetical protein
MKVNINIAIAAILAVGVDAGVTRRRRGVRHLGGKGGDMEEEEEIPSAPSKPDYSAEDSDDAYMSKGGGFTMSKESKEKSGKKEKVEKAPKGKGAASEGDDYVSAEHPEVPVEPEHPMEPEPPIACPDVPAATGGCLTVEGVNGIMTAFEGAVIAISDVSGSRTFCLFASILVARPTL